MNLKKTICVGIPVFLIVIFIYTIIVGFGLFRPIEKPDPHKLPWQAYQLELAYDEIEHGMSESDVIAIAGVPNCMINSIWFWNYYPKTQTNSLCDREGYELSVRFSNGSVFELDVGTIQWNADVGCKSVRSK